jgi:hypothetical protein
LLHGEKLALQVKMIVVSLHVMRNVVK